jgi:hypothetical protein
MLGLPTVRLGTASHAMGSTGLRRRRVIAGGPLPMIDVVRPE